MYFFKKDISGNFIGKLFRASWVSQKHYLVKGGKMGNKKVVAYEVFNFAGSNFYCSDCFHRHPDSKDWVMRTYGQKDLGRRGRISCCNCEKELQKDES